MEVVDSDFSQLVAEGLQFDCDMAMYGKVPKGYTTQWRIMPTAVTAGLVYGSALMEIEDQPPYLMRPGVGICLPAGVNHCFSHSEEGFAASSHVSFRIFGSLDLLSLVELPRTLSSKHCKRIVDINRQLAQVVDKQNCNLSDVCTRQALGFEMLRMLVDLGRTTPTAMETLRIGQRLAPVLHAIDAQLSSINIMQMCDIIHISRSRLHALFQQAFSCSPKEFLQRRRLHKARELLASSEYHIAMVAQLSGYEDPFHFSRAFKRAHGRSPSEYRQSMALRML
jgi:AraC-like DNA-binding protein